MRGKKKTLFAYVYINLKPKRSMRTDTDDIQPLTSSYYLVCSLIQPKSRNMTTSGNRTKPIQTHIGCLWCFAVVAVRILLIDPNVYSIYMSKRSNRQNIPENNWATDVCILYMQQTVVVQLMILECCWCWWCCISLRMRAQNQNTHRESKMQHVSKAFSVNALSSTIHCLYIVRTARTHVRFRLLQANHGTLATQNRMKCVHAHFSPIILARGVTL